MPKSRGPAGFNVFTIPGVIESKTCLLPLVTDKSWALLGLYRHYKNKILPYGGGILEQPNYYMQAMETLDKCQ